MSDVLIACRVSGQERGISLVNISQPGHIFKMRCLHIASTAPPQQVILITAENRCSTPSPLVCCSPTQSFAFFSLGSLPHLSVHPVTPVIHLFCFFPLFPLCFFSLRLCGSAQPHLNARPGMSSLPALGRFFTSMKKCNHPFL